MNLATDTTKVEPEITKHVQAGTNMSNNPRGPEFNVEVIISNKIPAGGMNEKA